MWSVTGVECSSLSLREWVRGPRPSPPRPLPGLPSAPLLSQA